MGVLSIAHSAEWRDSDEFMLLVDEGRASLPTLLRRMSRSELALLSAECVRQLGGRDPLTKAERRIERLTKALRNARQKARK